MAREFIATYAPGGTGSLPAPMVAKLVAQAATDERAACRTIAANELALYTGESEWSKGAREAAQEILDQIQQRDEA